MSQTRRVMERSIVAVMARLGATDPHSAALALMACSEGIILHRIARHDAADPPPYVPVVRRRTTPETQYSGICLDRVRILRRWPDSDGRDDSGAHMDLSSQQSPSGRCLPGSRP